MDLPKLTECNVTIIGLGYVGLPLTVELALKVKNSNSYNYQINGFDINKERLNQLIDGFDKTKEIQESTLKKLNNIKYTNNIEDIYETDVFIITVPTPINESKQPNLNPLKEATLSVGKALKKRTKKEIPVIIYESTVYPGATEEFCIPLLERTSNLKCNLEFVCGYSPERVNPGDSLHSLKNIIKITSGSNELAADWIDKFYSSIITEGTFKAASIKVAEAAKVIENTQRDINIALVNEFAIIFKRLGIDTLDVLEAAKTKWNFLPFKPGLVGGHCIGVDPYYLTYRAELTGYHTELILGGRRLNDGMGELIAKEIIFELAARGHKIKNSRILIMGITFKENCTDIRNTKVIDIINTLKRFKVKTFVFDPWADSKDVKKFYGLEIIKKIPSDEKYSVVISAVAHKEFVNLKPKDWENLIINNGFFYDIKGIIPREINPLRI